jgi:hypothetical protein
LPGGGERVQISHVRVVMVQCKYPGISLGVYSIFELLEKGKLALSLVTCPHQDDTKMTPKFQYSFQFSFYLVFIEKMLQ